MKFLVTYQMPHAGLDEWMNTPEEERKAAEQHMREAWDVWMGLHKGAFIETAGVGKPKRVTAGSVEDGRNDLMLYSVVEAESLDAAAALFKDHPHFGIPGSWIEVMPTQSIT